MRDKDALHFINQRDWKIIEKFVDKRESKQKKCRGPFKIKGEEEDKTEHSINDFIGLHSRNQRIFNIAYFQQIIIKEDVDDRTALLFSKKFLEKEEKGVPFLESNIG